MKKNEQFIFHPLRSSFGGGEDTKVEIVIDTHTGKSEVVVRHGLSARFPVTEIAKAYDLFERLICGSGRKAWKLEELAHPYNPQDS